MQLVELYLPKIETQTQITYIGYFSKKQNQTLIIFVLAVKRTKPNPWKKKETQNPKRKSNSLSSLGETPTPREKFRNPKPQILSLPLPSSSSVFCGVSSPVMLPKLSLAELFLTLLAFSLSSVVLLRVLLLLLPAFLSPPSKLSFSSSRWCCCSTVIGLLLLVVVVVLPRGSPSCRY